MSLVDLCFLFGVVCGEPSATSTARWDIGPVIDGQNYSVGMPRYMESNTFEFPRCSSPPRPRGPSVHYVTKGGNLDGKTEVRIAYEISGTGTLVATEGGAGPRVRLYFQRGGDNWSGEGRYATYRWWSTPFGDLNQRGVDRVHARLTPDNWSPVYPASETPSRFAEARDNTSRIGFTFGGSFAGHGVCAKNGTVRFTLRAFRVL